MCLVLRRHDLVSRVSWWRPETCFGLAVLFDNGNQCLRFRLANPLGGISESCQWASVEMFDLGTLADFGLAVM